MSSKVDVPEALKLREQGQTLEQIGQRFGVTRERVRQLVGPAAFKRECVQCGEPFTATQANRRSCSPRCYDRLWEAENSRQCVECQTRIGSRSTRCIGCNLDLLDRERDERWRAIKDLWDAGMPTKEMAARLGFKNTNVLGVQMARMKHAGWELPPRRPGWHGHDNYTPPPEKLLLTRQQVNNRLGYAIRMGLLERPDACERCGHEGRVEGHHYDYSKPLDVEWLCRDCHVAHHQDHAEPAQVAS